MAAFRPTGMKNGVIDEAFMPGDIAIGGESLLAGAIATVGAGTWTGAAIATGIINRTGPVGGYTDTTDSAQSILNALAGNSNGAEVVPGSTFRLLFVNTVAQAHTYAGGAGVQTGSGTVNTAASTWREYLFTVLNSTPSSVAQCNTTNASAVVTFVLPAGVVALPYNVSGNNPLGVTITPGQTVSGTGITAGTTVLGVTQGQGGVTGVTLSANATATSAAGGVPLTFTPTVKVDGLRSGTL